MLKISADEIRGKDQHVVKCLKGAVSLRWEDCKLYTVRYFLFKDGYEESAKFHTLRRALMRVNQIIKELNREEKQ